MFDSVSDNILCQIYSEQCLASDCLNTNAMMNYEIMIFQLQIRNANCLNSSVVEQRAEIKFPLRTTPK
jgi:hypothetical protein